MKEFDIVYCTGKGCALRTSCYRFVEGKKVSSFDDDHSFMDNCSPEYREGYMKI